MAYLSLLPEAAGTVWIGLDGQERASGTVVQPTVRTPVTVLVERHLTGRHATAVHQGRQRIVTIAGPQDMPVGRARLTGFRDAISRG